MVKKLNVPIIKTRRLVLEPLSMVHSPGMFALWSDPAVCQYSGIVHDREQQVIPTPVRTVTDSDRIIAFWLKAAVDGWGFRWAVVMPDHRDAFVGTVGFNSLSDSAEIAFHLLPAYWGKGIMAEASRAAIEWSCAQGVTCIEAFIESDNFSSIALAQALGMVASETDAVGVQRFELLR